MGDIELTEDSLKLSDFEWKELIASHKGLGLQAQLYAEKLQQRAEAAEQQLAILNGTAEILGEQVVSSECAATGLRQRLQQAESDRDKLVSVARSFWRRTYGWDNSLLDDEHVISDYLAISTLDRDTFDRLVKGGG